MTFNGWWATLTTREQARMVRDDVAEAWKAATSAEREECAKVCEALPRKFRVSDGPNPCSIKDECAAAIRTRSNVKCGSLMTESFPS
jgi:hypothetical protein